MSLKLGSGTPTALKLGSTTVTAVYLGSTQVYSTATFRERQIPGGPMLNESGTREAQVPGGPFVVGA